MASLESQIQDYIVANVDDTSLPGLAIADTEFVVYLAAEYEEIPTRDRSIIVTLGDTDPFEAGDHPQREVTIEIDVRALDYEEAREMAQSIEELLHVDSENEGIQNTELSDGMFAYYGFLTSGPAYAHTDESGRHIIYADYLITI